MALILRRSEPCGTFKKLFNYESQIQKRNRKGERKQKSSIILFLRNKNPVNTIYSMFLLKNWCFQTVVLEKTLESPLHRKEIKPVNLKGNQTWIFTGGTGAEAEAPILWPPDGKNWLNGKDPDAGKVWGQEEKGVTGWDGGMVSLTQWTGVWVWANSRRWWRMGKPGVLQFMGLQRVRHNWATEQQ